MPPREYNPGIQVALPVQLDRFLAERPGNLSRRLLRSPQLDVTVKINPRTLPQEVPCLDVVSPELKIWDSLDASTDVTPWAQFVGEAAPVALSRGIHALFLHEVTDSTILAWCRGKEGLVSDRAFYQRRTRETHPDVNPDLESFVLWTAPNPPVSR